MYRTTTIQFQHRSSVNQYLVFPSRRQCICASTAALTGYPTIRLGAPSGREHFAAQSALIIYALFEGTEVTENGK